MNRLRLSLLLLSILLASASHIGVAHAEIKVEVSGNGSDSQNSVDVAHSSSDTVEQTNNAQVNNDVSSTANSGANQANGNGSDVNVTTGNASSETSVSTQLNNSQVNTGCCLADASVVISGNGSGSQNRVSLTQEKELVISVDQKATVVNRISLTASTGNNQANKNNGDVEIATGKINASLDLVNQANISLISAGVGSGNVSVKIAGNGDNSNNQVAVAILGNLFINRTNNAKIKNLINSDLNTGGNQANENNGAVEISTGDINFALSLVNGPINVGGVKIGCCDTGGDGDGDHCHDGDSDHNGNGGNGDQEGCDNGDGGGGGNGDNNGGGSNGGNNNGSSSDNPSTSGSGSSGSSGSSNGSGQVLGALADILPGTGISAHHNWLLTVMYFMMFLIGLYMRLRAGRSPDKKYAYIYTS